MSLSIDNAKELQNSRLAGLAAQARLYSDNLTMNILELGRVFTEAKELVKHGEWGNWLRENSGMGERSAQQFMQVYARFGKKPELISLEKSKLIKMLSLPPGKEEEFIENNDIESMTSREVEAAVKQVRAEMQEVLDSERRMRQGAEEEAADLKKRLNNKDDGEIPDDIVKKLKEQESTIRQQRGMLETAQQTIDENRRKLIEQERKSAISDAMPDIEKLDEQLRAAVSAFLSSPAGTAAEDSRRVMKLSAIEREDIGGLVAMMENWCIKMRNKLNEYAGEGAVL